MRRTNTRSLPPSFLLPSWTTRQLQLLIQRRPIYQKTRIQNRGGGPPKPQGESLFGVRRLDLTPPLKPPTSLFEELFPEEKDKSHTPSYALPSVRHKHKPPPPSQPPFSKISPFDWTTNIEIFSEAEVQRRAAEKERKDWNIVGKERGKEEEDAAQRREASVLILNCASKTLEESDFFRLSPKGEHIEGWTSGIIKIIPGRDPQTLESLGHYFILFSSRAAALAYFHRTIDLHTLSRNHPPNSIVLPPPTPNRNRPPPPSHTPPKNYKRSSATSPSSPPTRASRSDSSRSPTAPPSPRSSAPAPPPPSPSRARNPTPKTPSSSPSTSPPSGSPPGDSARSSTPTASDATCSGASPAKEPSCAWGRKPT
ncbi:hypothetical protein EYC80_010862 [Monilinia laxa]|uniref:RRM domain-containing protein n=1 Tax=Monilinia laxa TaxID=61186 RepID=A0A5N6JS13_MONLA|nr:hypothetical protein EYC80_010862 [Monilinia laxa]